MENEHLLRSIIFSNQIFQKRQNALLWSYLSNLNFPSYIFHNEYKTLYSIYLLDASLISLLVKSRLDLCMEESTCREIVINLSQRFISMLCSFILFALIPLF